VAGIVLEKMDANQKKNTHACKASKDDLPFSVVGQHVGNCKNAKHGYQCKLQPGIREITGGLFSKTIRQSVDNECQQRNGNEHRPPVL